MSASCIHVCKEKPLDLARTFLESMRTTASQYVPAPESTCMWRCMRQQGNDHLTRADVLSLAWMSRSAARVRRKVWILS